MECFARSTFTPKFMWKLKKNGQSELQLVADGHDPLTPDYFIKLGEWSQVLIIKKAEWNHGGVYKCNVSTGNDSIQTDAELNVLGRYSYELLMSNTHLKPAHTSITIYSASK